MSKEELESLAKKMADEDFAYAVERIAWTVMKKGIVDPAMVDFYCKIIEDIQTRFDETIHEICLSHENKEES